MRPSQKSNRTRGRGNRKPNGNNLNRVYESAGPEGKVRGTPQQIIDKYLSLARDAQTSGDRVVAENFLQHAEHYQRILVEAMGARQERRDNQPFDGDQPDVQDSDGGDEAAVSGGEQRDNAAQRGGQDAAGGGGKENGRREGRPPREAEVSGLTTIDAGDGEADSLLVDAEDLGSSQPRKRRRPERVTSQPEPVAQSE